METHRVVFHSQLDVGEKIQSSVEEEPYVLTTKLGGFLPAVTWKLANTVEEWRSNAAANRQVLQPGE
jgi:hypothetical protein